LLPLKALKTLILQAFLYHKGSFEKRMHFFVILAKKGVAEKKSFPYIARLAEEKS